ncbi:MAG: metallophosphoesterase family protein, partial [Akkermansiaceae bacterium]|nr:metallophosphoesterase family protein [Akkermansiaceae bacterium]
MRTLAISDIHGCLDPLEKMIEIIKPTPEDHLIFVGDYVDRGPNSKGVIDFLINIKNKYNATFLHGNHEEKFLLSHLDKTDLA